jgi:peptidoglycan/xylan/chitin deacetylase (PgdA/CDA1 family)
LSGTGGWGPDGRRAALTVSFDNLGEVTDLQRGLWPDDEPLGRHFSVTRALPRILALLDVAGVRATFFVEGRNTELYPGTLTGIAAAGHEVAYHGWCHEPWADLGAPEEAELLDRGVGAMKALGLRPVGFRPPGGRLTLVSLELLRERRFAHCSPAGDGVGVRDGIVVLPFRWPMIDAYHYLPRFAALRARDFGSGAALPPAALARRLDAALRNAVRHGAHLSVVFHPFLAEPRERFDVMRRHLRAVRRLVDDGVIWCAPYREVAESIARSDAGAEWRELRLDATVA